MSTGSRPLRALLSVLAAGCLSQASAAAPKLAVVAVGNCKSVDLIHDADLLAQTLKAKAPDQALDSEDLHSRLTPKKGPAMVTLLGELEAGKNDFYEGKLASSLRHLEGVIVESAKLPPSKQRWQLSREAQSFRYLVAKQRAQQPVYLDALRAILRVDPKFVLDKDLFAPSAQEQLEKTRREMERGPRAWLEVASKGQTGIPVSVEGRPVGVTPYKELYPSGKNEKYEVTLGKEGAFSARHQVTLTEAKKVVVDFPFETALVAQTVVCLPLKPDDVQGYAAGARVAKLVDAEEVVVLALEPRQEGGDWLRTTRVEVDGLKVSREGGIKVDSGLIPHASLDDLANFVLRGERGNSIQTGRDIPRLYYRPLSAPPLVSAGPGPGEPVGVSTRGASRMTAGVWGFGAGALVALAAGIAFEIDGASAWTQFNGAFSGSGPQASQAAGLASLRQRGQTDQVVGLVCFGVAVAAAGTATALYVWHPPTTNKGAGVTEVRVHGGPGSLALAGVFQ